MSLKLNILCNVIENFNLQIELNFQYSNVIKRKQF